MLSSGFSISEFFEWFTDSWYTKFRNIAPTLIYYYTGAYKTYSHTLTASEKHEYRNITKPLLNLLSNILDTKFAISIDATCSRASAA